MSTSSVRKSEQEATAPTRRGFCLQACQVASLAALAPMLQGCGGSSPTSPGGGIPALSVITSTVSNNTISLNVDGASPLATIGAAALVRASGREVLVVRTGAASAVAMTAICTHENCTVSGFQNERFVCPCHGSQFSTTGAVLVGPATRALAQFSTALNGSTLTIAL